MASKILSIRKCIQPAFSYVDFPCYVSRAFLIISTQRVDLKFLLALLNSKVVSFWLSYQGKLQGDLYQIDKTPLMKIPLVVPPIFQQMQIIRLVDEVLSKTSNNSDTTELEHQINQMVYKLYGLTEEEIKTVEKQANVNVATEPILESKPSKELTGQLTTS
jgi:adenine-specific DNA-methyltransferase